MEHIVLKENNICIREDSKTLEYLRQLCDKKTITRTFSKWHNINKVYEMLRMLGFTIKYVSNNGSIQYQLISWYGSKNDKNKVLNIIEDLI